MFKSEKGASAVEFALIAPLLFVLTFGIIEFSLLLFDKAVVTNASREGARAAVVYNIEDEDYMAIPKTEVEAVVDNYASAHLISLGSNTADLTTVVSYTDTEGAESTVGVSQGDVTVTVTYPYSFLVLTNIIKLIDGDLSGTISVVGTTVMRME